MAAAWLLALCIPAFAHAAAQVSQSIGEGQSGFWINFLIVQIMTALGYCCSSLAKWAKWPDGNLEDRLMIGQGVAASLLGGNIGYYGGMNYLPTINFNPSEMACFIVAAVAGFGGEKFIEPLLATVTAFFSRFTIPQRKPPGGPS